MNSAITALAILAGVLSLTASQPYVATMDIASCADLVAAAEATSGGDIMGHLVAENIECDVWTTIEIRSNKLKLVSDFNRTKLTKVRFAVAYEAVLRVEIPKGPLEFAAEGDYTQEVNGAYLNIAAGGRARFFTTAVFMYSAGVMTVSEDSRTHGGCVYNAGYLRFEGGFGAGSCWTSSTDPNVIPGNGGAVWNGPGAKLIVKGLCSYENNGEPTGLTNAWRGGRDGGAIYTEGKVSCFKGAEFIDNHGDQGGAIFIAEGGEVKFLKEGSVHFTESYAEGNGGAIANYGSLVVRRPAVFEDNKSEASGGAIYSDSATSEMLWVKHVDFLYNSAGAHGGAVATNYDLIKYLPEDATFEGNFLVNSDRDYVCKDMYANGSADGGEDGYTCLP
eukprot:g9680.t1